MRPSRDQTLMEHAQVTAKRSTCLRLHVGAVIARDGRIISTGYAGSPSGVEHCNHENCGPEQPCTRTVHAEAGAIAFAARHGVALEGSTIYCTHAPCLDCSKLIINTRITRVVYNIPYRKTEGIELLKSVGIFVEEWDGS